MHMSATTRSMAVKALRVLLVFSLVFWSSFRIEMVAFAADEASESQTGQPIDVDDANPDAPSNPATGGDDAEETDGPASPSTPADPTDTTEPDTPETSETTFANLEVHLLNENPPAASADPLKHVGDFVYDSAALVNQVNTPKIDAVQGELEFVPIIVQTDGTKLDASDMVEWSVEDQYLEFADFTEVDGKKTNVLKAKGEEDSEIIVVCALKADEFEQFGLDSKEAVEVRFRVSITEQAGSYITAIELLDENGEALAANATLKLDMGGNPSLSYQFAALVKVADPSSTAEEKEYTLDPSDTSSLSEHDKALIDSLTWSVSGSAGASIDDTGLFVATEKLETSVICTSGKGVGGSSVSMSVTVNTGLDVGVQGASHPQDTLLVIVPSEVVKAADADDDADANTGADADAGDNAGADEGGIPGESGGSDDSGGVAMSTAAEQEGDSEAAVPPDEPDDASGENADADADAEEPKAEPVNKAYSLDELSLLGWSMATYTLAGATEGASGEDSDTTTITGAGPSLVAVLEDAGVDFTKVRSVTFVNYQGDSQTIAWSSLGGEDSTAMLAANSLVHVDGEEAPSDESSLLNNTCFRLLVADGASVDSALPWVNTIRVNGDGAGDDGGSTTDSSLRAVIGYIPVAKGSTAILSASVVGLYQAEQFGYEWQESNDGGVTWSETIDTAQTLRVPTSDSTIGRMYRVVATTNTGRKAESDPVTIAENTGFSVALAYDPPLAGEMAFFTTSVTGVDPSEITDYIWEWTEDGGDTWQEIAGSRGSPTFSAQTNPIDSPDDESDEQGDGSSSGESADSDQAADKEEIDKTPAPSMWVHVRVLATGGREAVSNPVMLTVHVSEDPGTGQLPTEEVPDELPDEPSAPGSDDPVVMPTEPEAEPQPAPGPVIQEVSSIRTETAPRPESTSQVVTSEPEATEQRPDGTQTTPTPESAPSESEAPADLIINPEVTAEILEQQEAISEAVQATRPGARWTALTTVDPDGNDVQRILSDNPFVPFTAPFALGITAAGFVEKLLGFRRQVR